MGGIESNMKGWKLLGAVAESPNSSSSPYLDVVAAASARSPTQTIQFGVDS
jgi:hypothetical protein